MIPTVFHDQTELLRAIMALHCPDGWDLDPTYAVGAFYRKGIPQPALKFDLVPRREGVVQADCRDLPVDAMSVGSVMFDPPFLHHCGENSIMGRRYGSYHNQAALHEMYAAAMREFRRILKPDGTLTFKCQDVVEASNQVMTHCNVLAMAQSLDFRTEDLLVLLKPARSRGWNHANQQHARKTHCYFWVFRKRTPREVRRAV